MKAGGTRIPQQLTPVILVTLNVHAGLGNRLPVIVTGALFAVQQCEALVCLRWGETSHAVHLLGTAYLHCSTVSMKDNHQVQVANVMANIKTTSALQPCCRSIDGCVLQTCLYA